MNKIYHMLLPDKFVSDLKNANDPKFALIKKGANNFLARQMLNGNWVMNVNALNEFPELMEYIQLSIPIPLTPDDFFKVTDPFHGGHLPNEDSLE